MIQGGEETCWERVSRPIALAESVRKREVKNLPERTGDDQVPRVWLLRGFYGPCCLQQISSLALSEQGFWNFFFLSISLHSQTRAVTDFQVERQGTVSVGDQGGRIQECSHILLLNSNLSTPSTPRQCPVGVILSPSPICLDYLPHPHLSCIIYHICSVPCFFHFVSAFSLFQIPSVPEVLDHFLLIYLSPRVQTVHNT